MRIRVKAGAACFGLSGGLRLTQRDQWRHLASHLSVRSGWGIHFLERICMGTQMQTKERVRSSTSRSQNQKIDRETKINLARYKDLDSASIQERIRELDKTWDIERTLMFNAATLSLTGAMLALFVNKKWAIMPAVVTSFLIQHTLQGWCPPLPLFRMMGIKSARSLTYMQQGLRRM